MTEVTIPPILATNDKTTSSNTPMELSDGIELLVSHGKNTYSLPHLSEDLTISNLKKKIFEVSQVQPFFQKLILKGVTLKDEQTLKDLKMKNKTKIMLIGNKMEEVASVNAGVASPAKKRSDSNPEKKAETITRLSQLKEHEKVVKKGVPEGAEPGEKGKNWPLPKSNSIKGVYDSRGELVRLTFKNEIQELWIGSKDRTDKINYAQIRDVESDPIHTNENYEMLGLQLGLTPNTKQWFYFVPAQYIKAIKYCILNGGISAIPLLKEHGETIDDVL